MEVKSLGEKSEVIVYQGEERDIHSTLVTMPEDTPSGGGIKGMGFTVNWQKGPRGTGDERAVQNGAIVEDLIGAVIIRLAEFQDSALACDENADAIKDLEAALEKLQSRTDRREEEGVHGTSEA